MGTSISIIAKPYDAEIVRRILLEAEYDSQVLSCGDDVPEQLKERHPAVVVLFERLDGADAVAVLRQVREVYPVGTASVVLIVDRGSPLATPARARALEVDQLLLRPLDPVLLLAKIDMLVSGMSPAAVTRAAAAEVPWEAESMVERLDRKQAQVREGTYFEVLDLETEASIEQIQRAHTRILLELDPTRFPDDMISSRSEQLTEILEVIEEAYMVLSNSALRDAYRENLT